MADVNTPGLQDVDELVIHFKNKGIGFRIGWAVDIRPHILRCRGQISVFSQQVVTVRKGREHRNKLDVMSAYPVGQIGYFLFLQNVAICHILM